MEIALINAQVEIFTAILVIIFSDICCEGNPLPSGENLGSWAFCVIMPPLLARQLVAENSNQNEGECSVAEAARLHTSSEGILLSSGTPFTIII